MKGECLKLLSILRSQLAAHLAPWHLQNMAMPLEDAWNWERSRTESREKPYPLFLVRDHVKNPEQHCEGVAADGFTIASTRDPSISCNVFCVFIIIIIYFFFLTALRRRTHNWYLAIIALETSTTNKFPSCQVSLWSCFFVQIQWTLMSFHVVAVRLVRVNIEMPSNFLSHCIILYRYQL